MRFLSWKKKISKDSRKFMKTFCIILNFSRKWLCSIQTLKSQRFRGEYHDLLILQGLFFSCICFILHSFGKCVSQAFDSSHSSIRSEKLVCWHEIEVFSPQVRDSCLRHKTWHTYNVTIFKH